MNELKFTVAVRGANRVIALDRLVARDHSSRTAVLNKGLDLLIKHEARLERLCAGEEVIHDADD
jgi:hypothetical protein